MLTVDDLKRIFQVSDDQDLAVLFGRSPAAVSKWRNLGLPAAIERKAHEIVQQRGIVCELTTPYSTGSAAMSPELAEHIEAFKSFDPVTQKMLGRVFDRMKGLSEEEQWKICSEQLEKIRSRGGDPPAGD